MGNGRTRRRTTPPTDPNADEKRSLRERLGELNRSHGYIDPSMGNAFETDLQTVSVAPATTGPQRLSMLVPADHAEMNLGQAFAGRAELDDQGISARTDTHIDFRTRAAGTCTTVTMGDPATRAEHTWDGDNLPKATVGYGMGTEKCAWRHADQRVYVLSNTGDVVVRAASDKTAVLQSSQGHVIANAGEAVAITSGNTVLIGAGVPALPTPKWNTPWPLEAKEMTRSFLSNTAGTFAAVVASGLATLNKLNTPMKVAKVMVPGTTPKPLPAPRFIKALAVLGGLSDMAWMLGNTVRIHADRNVSASGKKSASLWGTVSANVVGGVSASLVGCTADAKGFATAGVWGGLEAALASLKKVVVKSSFADIHCYSKEETKIASNKSVSMQSTGSAQLNGDNKVAVYGNKAAYVLCEDHGLHVTPESAMICKINSPRHLFTSAAQDKFMKIDNSSIVLQHSDGNAKLVVAKDRAELVCDSSTSLLITDSKVVWTGKFHQLA